MIDFIKVKKQFGSQVVLDAVTFRINPGERVGVVGPNGAGKSTIFYLVTRDQEPDGGEVILPKNTRLGHLRQQLNAYAVDDNLLEYAANAVPELVEIHDEIHRLEHAMVDDPSVDRVRTLARIGELQHEYEHLGGYEMRQRAEAALSGLGFRESEFSRPFQSFSGGWQMRAELVRTLIGRPDILLLDEPSNYLDLPAVEWLQHFLRDFPGTILLISHDRYLLKTLTDRILEVSGGQTVKYQGGYDYYVRERDSRREQQAAAYRNYMEQKEHLVSFINRFRAKASKAAQVQSRIKMLEKMDEIKAPVRPPDLSHLRIAEPPHCGEHMIQLEDAGFTYDGERWVFRHVDLEIRKGDKVALVGFNGMGKSTLLRTLSGTFPLREGSRKEGYKVVVGYQSQEFAETMPPDKDLFTILKEANPLANDQAVRTLLGSFGFSGDAAEKKCLILSGGEKIRMAFARIFIKPPNILLLDEPTTHLDIHGREALEKSIRAYKGTVVLVSHDVTFVRNTAQRIIALSPSGLSDYPGGYDYYLEKTAASTAAAPATLKPVAVEIEKTDSATTGVLRGKDARVARAQQREAEKVLKKLEHHLKKLQAERETLHAQFAASEPGTDFGAINIRFARLNEEIEKTEIQWLEESESVSPDRAVSCSASLSG